MCTTNLHCERTGPERHVEIGPYKMGRMAHTTVSKCDLATLSAFAKNVLTHIVFFDI
jgi:hypothetical protein